MRRLYMQKNMATGSRGMMATGWLCEQCNFSDIITKFKESRIETARHPALTCECQTCGGIHKKGIDSSYITEDEEQIMRNILERLSNPKKQIDGLILINNLDDPSKYLGLVMGTFIWSGSDDYRQIAKDVFTTHATDLQRELIDSVWKKSWKRKGWRPLHGERFKRKVEERSIDIDQILGIGVILNHRITESTFKTIDMLNSPEIYVDTALKVNPHLTEEYAKRAISEGDNELAVKYLTMAIKGGKHKLLRNYVDIKGQEATEFILEQLEEKKPADDSRWYQDRHFYDALSRTGAPNAAVVLIEHFCEDGYDRDYLLKIGDANSDYPLIRALNVLNGKDSFDVQEMLVALVSVMDDYGPIEFLVQHYNDLIYEQRARDAWAKYAYDGAMSFEQFHASYTIDPEETMLFSEVIASGDYEKTKRFIRETMGINSSYYQHYLLKKDPDGIRKFLFNDEPGLRLMGTSMGKSTDISTELEEYVFAMSFLDTEESVREGATELMKEKGISQLPNIFNSEGALSFDLPTGYGSTPMGENLERLIGYEDARFLPIILRHIHEFDDLKEPLVALLEKLNSNRKQTIEMLFQIAVENTSVSDYEWRYGTNKESCNNAIRTALNVNKQISCELINNAMTSGDSRGKLEKIIFMMSFLDTDKSTREGATELVKEIGLSQLTNIFDPEGGPTFNPSPTWISVEHQRENLERLIDYQDSRFIPLIIKHIHEFDDLKESFVALLKTLNPDKDKDQIVEMLFQIAIEDAPQTPARNAARMALDINRQKSYDWIRNMMKMTTGKDRGDRKQSVNRRLMFIEVFGEIATPEDIPYLQELMKKDRSPRVKIKLVRMIMDTHYKN